MCFLSLSLCCCTNNSTHTPSHKQPHICSNFIFSQYTICSHDLSFLFFFLECKTFINKKNMSIIKPLYLLVFISSLCTGNRWYRMFNSNHDDPCIDRHHRFQRCIPDFINAAFRKSIYASSTCGNPAKEFCSKKNVCHACDTSQTSASYPTDYLTDMNNPNNLTCLQSDENSFRRKCFLNFIIEEKIRIDLY